VRVVAVDTNAYVAFKRGDANVIEVFRQTQSIVLSTVVLGELFAGFLGGTREADNRKELGQFLGSPRVRITAITQSTAEAYARVFTELRRKGRPIPSNDLWIAATALEVGAPLLTFDGHFAAIEGLRSGSEMRQLTQ
jgi:predicted nucleic acid-binding protein